MKIQFNYNCQEEFEDTKGLIKIRKSRKDRQHNGQKKDRQHNGQKKMNKNSNNDLQNTTQKTEDRASVHPMWSLTIIC